MGNCIGFKCFEHDCAEEDAQPTVVSIRNGSKRVPILKNITENKLILKRQMYKKHTVASIGDLTPPQNPSLAKKSPDFPSKSSPKPIRSSLRRSKSNIDRCFKFIDLHNTQNSRILKPTQVNKVVKFSEISMTSRF